MARVEGPVIEPPSGGQRPRVYFNDAGAAHSGLFWTWIVRGNRVIAEGYSATEVCMQQVPFPIEWIDDKTFEVTFHSERYGGTTRTATVKLK